MHRLIPALLLPAALGAQAPQLSVAPAEPEPGAIARIAVAGASGADSVVAVRGIMGGERLHFFPAPDGWRALGPVPIDASDSVVAHVVVERASSSVDTLRMSIPVPPLRAAEAPPQRLAVAQRFTQPMDSATQARVARESARAREVGRRSHETPPMWTETFLRPRPTSARITSQFGTGRVFNGRTTSRHLGVDFAGAEGTPVRAANRGVVALVDTFFLGGIVVYLDHGAGLTTSYLHMSRANVKAGDVVERGQQIGLVGATGRVTGPHLHFAARLGTQTVNPMDLLALEQGWIEPAAAIHSP